MSLLLVKLQQLDGHCVPDQSIARFWVFLGVCGGLVGNFFCRQHVL